MELKSFQHNGIKWKCRFLGEDALLLEPDSVAGKLSLIHQFSSLIEEYQIKGVVDIVPAYESLALIFDDKIINHIQLIKILSESSFPKVKEKASQLFEVPVCYDLGLDWDEVTAYSGKSKKSVIEIHSSKIYTVAMMGFLPGFVFLDGLESLIACPRKSTPRTNIPSGAVGIGGNQTGFYSLESPGGWNIIGRTPISFFDIAENPPSKLTAGDRIKFQVISKSEYEEF